VLVSKVNHPGLSHYGVLFLFLLNSAPAHPKLWSLLKSMWRETAGFVTSPSVSFPSCFPDESWILWRPGFWLTHCDGFLKTIFFFPFGETGVWTQGFMSAKQVLSCLSHTSSSFALVILEMGSPELFIWVGLESQSFQSQPPVANLSHWWLVLKTNFN
jgi:hypothetical protein